MTIYLNGVILQPLYHALHHQKIKNLKKKKILKIKKKKKLLNGFVENVDRACSLLTNTCMLNNQPLEMCQKALKNVRKLARKVYEMKNVRNCERMLENIRNCQKEERITLNFRSETKIVRKGECQKAYENVRKEMIHFYLQLECALLQFQHLKNA